jgi:aminoglycoside phosphotransferase (APT) family kinase protein
MHPGQLVIDAKTVRVLVVDQFPSWSDLDVHAVASPGTVHALYRIGDEMVARFPLQPGDPAVVRGVLVDGAAAAAELLGRTRFATPVPLAIGEPGEGYPLPWSVQRWIPGVTAVDSDVADSDGLAADLAEFVEGVRSLDVRGRRFHGAGRGGVLSDHDAWVARCLDESEGLLEVPRLRAGWAAMRELPRVADDAMTHGDLIATNVLVADGRLTGVLDVEGLGPADPALDLVSAWSVLGPRARRTLRRTLDEDELSWARGRAWAFEQAIGLVWYYRHTNPTMSELGRRMLDGILAEPH